MLRRLEPEMGDAVTLEPVLTMLDEALTKLAELAEAFAIGLLP